MPLAKPYSWYGHPDKTWIDIFLGFVFMCFLPLHKIVSLQPVKEDEEVKKLNNRFRNFLERGSMYGGKAAVAKWRKVMDNTPIVQINYSVPRRNLLKEWGLYKEPFEVPPEKCIPVCIRFPLPKDTKGIDQSQMNDYGCVEANEFDLKDLPADVPFVIQFYGGGMTIGVFNDADGLNLTVSTSDFESKPIIFAQSYYSQSPEYPFPVAVEEALTVVSHLVETCPNRRFHISGISAGGNLATVATLEMHRRYPGRIASSLICCPMLLPAANTQSYYTDTYQSYLPATWLRWAWRAYLPLLDDPKKEEKELQELDSMDERLNYRSNKTAWEKLCNSKQQNGGFPARLVSPSVDIPSGLEDQKVAPKIVVMSNRGDPLRDDAADLVQKLESAGANVKHVDFPGSHWLGVLLDKRANAQLVSSWRDILFSE